MSNGDIALYLWVGVGAGAFVWLWSWCLFKNGEDKGFSSGYHACRREVEEKRMHEETTKRLARARK